MGKDTSKPAATLPAPSAAEVEAKQRGKALWAAMSATIDGQIAGNRDHGWGGEDSMAVIEAVVAEDASLSKCGDVVKFTLSGEALRMIAAVVNPSAFRQKLEDPKGLNRLNPSKRGRTSVDFEKEFGS